MVKRSHKREALLDLFSQWENCQKCKLAETRKRIVFGDGNPDADLVVIGMGPGENEDLEGLPFIGESGMIINDYLKELRLSRDEVFFMNIVQCRPFNEVQDFKTGRKKEENRDPTQPERDACRPLWQEMLYIVDPLLVIAMGKPTVIETTGRRSATMGDVQGLIDTCTIRGRAGDVAYPVMCMYHPAFLSRSGNMYRGGPWHKAMIAWRRAVYFLDQMRRLYRDIPTPDRGFERKDMFLIKEGIF